MPFSPAATMGLFAAAGLLLAAPGAVYVRRLLPDRSLLEAAAAGYAVVLAAFVVLLALVDVALGAALTGPVAGAVYVLTAAPALLLALPRLRRGAWGLADLAGPRTDPRRLAGTGGLAVLLLAVAALWAGHSNITRGYAYLHHVDGYIHWGNARAVMDHGGLPYPSWISGGGAQTPTDETGFWYLLSGLAWLTPLSLTEVALHGKLVFVAGLALGAWAYGSRDTTGFGLEAAFLVPLIPTTHRFLGPMFLVPMTVVLSLALGAGILARSGSRRRAVPLLVLVGAGGLLIHSATAGVVALVAGWRLLLGFRTRREVAYAAVAAVAFAAGFLAIVWNVPHLASYWDRMVEAWTASQDLTPHGRSGGGADYLRRHLTRWTTLLFGLGVVAAFRGRRADAQALVLSVPPILAIMVAYERWTRGFASLYDRTFFFLGFLFLMVAGVGLAEARRAAVAAHRRGRALLERPDVREELAALARSMDEALPDHEALERGRAQARAWVPTLGLVVAAGLGPAVSVLAVGGVYGAVDPVKRDTYYNTEPGDDVFERLSWIRDHLDELGDPSLALADPLHGNELAAVTGIPVWVHPSHPGVRAGEAPATRAFLEDGCRPLDYLNRTGADLVVGADCREGRDLLEQAREGVYLYEPAREGRKAPG
jgi:hypothetical protein